MIADRGGMQASSAQLGSSNANRLDLSRPSGTRTVTNFVAVGLCALATVLAIIPLVWILWSVITKGLPVITNATWWSHDQVGVTMRRVGGGAVHALVGTVEIGLICGVVAVPLAVLGAIYLVEYGRGSKLARGISFMVDILSGIPSIVAALFLYALVITIFGLNRSAVAAAMSLVLLMLPVVLRSTEEMLKLVPDSLREASYALGVPKWKTVMQVVLPTAFGGIATGVVLGLARVMGETAPLLILVAYATNLQFDPASTNLATLPTMINAGRDTPEQMPGYARVWGAALTLILLVMLLNLLARGISRSTRLKER